MKTTERFDRALKALVTAFFDERLAKGTCTACAVGNIVAGAYGRRAVPGIQIFCDGINITKWQALFATSSNVQHKRFGLLSEQVPDGLRLIEKTGYSELEMARVEYAFEVNTNIFFGNYKQVTKEEIAEDQFNGLMAVVDVLCEIEGYDSKEYKKLFEYTPEFQPVNAM